MDACQLQGMISLSSMLVILIMTLAFAIVASGGGGGHHDHHLIIRSDNLCKQCSKCDVTHQCPASEAYPHMTAFDDALIAGALQSDNVDPKDTGVYSVPDVKGGESDKYNAYYG